MARQQRMLAELKKAERRRKRRPVAEITAPVELKIKRGAENRIIDNHQDVLYSIEAMCTRAYREDPRVDDEIVAAALRSAIRKNLAQDPAARELGRTLRGLRGLYSHISDETWTDCLRVVYASVCRHSSRRDGDVSYLRFVSAFAR